MTTLRRWGRGLFLAALSLLPAGIMLAYRFPQEAAAGISFLAGLSWITALAEKGHRSSR